MGNEMTNELFPTEETVDNDLEEKVSKKQDGKDNQIEVEKKLTPKERKINARYEELKLYKNPDAYAKNFIELLENKNRTPAEEKIFKDAVDYQMSVVNVENKKLKFDESIKTPEEKIIAENHNKVLCGVLLIDFVKRHPEFRSVIDAHAKIYMKKADLKVIKY